jgi:hypothetical protein
MTLKLRSFQGLTLHFQRAAIFFQSHFLNRDGITELLGLPRGQASRAWRRRPECFCGRFIDTHDWNPSSYLSNYGP